MEPFTIFTAVAAPLPLANIDTDKILAARFLKTIHRAGLRDGLFASLREDSDFVLNRTPWNVAGILIAGDNFGCGSSREHAPWALLDFGIRCVIASSIADIFYNNCFKNGILPIVLMDRDVQILTALSSNAATAKMTIDLAAQCILAAGCRVDFPIDKKRKHDLMCGLDEIDESLGHWVDIDVYEQRAGQIRPWESNPSATEIDIFR